ncbi:MULTISPECIES: hypothetical protein [Streptomyces]|uniref:hypothetical protein n=1 Tax=Streptomyces TaxID=1883 RepID=UPI00163B8261|nr:MULTISPECIES: hypothetical protein [Streptomyces]MBC2879311.1 hypothetical protein [Streptomyces sp. TYQ1024]UBI40089.1 hypothetical protein K7I03_28950 [Streptomyces mobaraensis]UKW32668.1 hypothetical protein MCU78_28880 [Streptomyces sp. TYQ1024]
MTTRSPQTVPEAPTVSEAALEERRAAGRALDEALRARGLHPLLRIGTTAGHAVTVTITASTPFWNGPEHATVPAPDEARALEQALLAQDIKAQARAIGDVEPAMEIRLHSCRDAHRLAGLVMEHLPEAHAAAHRLRTALATVGIEAENLRPKGGQVDVNVISAVEAITLVRVLGFTGCDGLDPHDGAHLESITTCLGQTLRHVLGCFVDVMACYGACSSCGRPHEVTVGPVSPGTALQLADAVTATASKPLEGDPADAAPRADDGRRA